MKHASILLRKPLVPKCGHAFPSEATVIITRRREAPSAEVARDNAASCQHLTVGCFFEGTCRDCPLFAFGAQGTGDGLRGDGQTWHNTMNDLGGGGGSGGPLHRAIVPGI
jgi:hypothetical protein